MFNYVTYHSKNKLEYISKTFIGNIYEIGKTLLGRSLVDLSNSDVADWLAPNEGAAEQDGIAAFCKVVHPTIQEHIREFRDYLHREKYYLARLPYRQR